MPKAPSFDEWKASPVYPFARSSDLVQYNTAKAMREAFNAGRRYERRGWEQLKVTAAPRKGFSFDD